MEEITTTKSKIINLVGYAYRTGLFIGFGVGFFLGAILTLIINYYCN